MSALTIAYLIVLTIAFIIGMVRYKKLTIPFRILTWSLFSTILLETFARYLTIEFKNNALAYHLMSINGYIFYSLVYYSLFKNINLKKIILTSVLFVVLFFFINILFIQQPLHKEFPTNIYLVVNTLQVIWSLLLFKQMLQYSLNLNIVKQSIFWYNAAILFFSSTMSLSMELLNYYVKHNWGYDIVFYLWAGEFCLFNLLLGISLLLDHKENSSGIWALKT
jgi:hypothetical protein